MFLLLILDFPTTKKHVQISVILYLQLFGLKLSRCLRFIKNKKITNKISSIFTKIFLSYTDFSWIIFYAKLSQTLHFTYKPNYLILDWLNFVLMIFHQSKIVLFPFFHLLTCTNSTTFLDAMPQVLILCLFTCYIFAFFKSFTSRHTSNLNNSFIINANIKV